ncbi:MAG: nicotinate-nucleotide--dimethylbenzimidazole phosphoribosyltransferase [Lentisphaeria bacterium]|nr:nicotinate-nucleotide--dimethylbenzimidazole phosphoribosyltransferase [Lentisphaeria bacterium]
MNYFDTACDKMSNLAKPIGSLGDLEYFAAKIAQCQKTNTPQIDKARVSVFAGDHGIANAECISPFPSSVTSLMLKTFKAGKATINSIAMANDVEVEVINCGVQGLNKESTLFNSKIKSYYEASVDGPTGNLKLEAALTEDGLKQSIQAGKNAALRAVEDHVSICGAGEMGIGNTTSATAIFAKLLNLDPFQITGPGAGLDQEGVHRKTIIIQEALLRIKSVHEPLEVLKEVGGFEIAAMTGFFIELTKHGIPILLDGFITTAAACVAIKVDKNVKENLIVSSISGEPAHEMLLKKLGLEFPVFRLGLRLGEGTGACLAVPVIKAACYVLNHTASLDEVLEGKL